ncbi:MAG: hypothetical protein ABSG15_16025 [FCB group bacterium]|jgi:hypothetical protein
MKTGLKIILAFFLFSIVVVFRSNAQSDSTKSGKLTVSKTTILTEIPKTEIFYLSWTKKSPPPINNSDNSSINNGNNFISISASPFYFLANDFGVGYKDYLQFGNINGDFAFYVAIIPEIVYGGDIMHIYIGAGPGVLAFSKNVNTGGFGISSELGIEFTIYKGIGFNIGVGFEQYAHANYYTTSLGINYIVR